MVQSIRRHRGQPLLEKLGVRGSRQPSRNLMAMMVEDGKSRDECDILQAAIDECQH
jgi:hypothetical protein